MDTSEWSSFSFLKTQDGLSYGHQDVTERLKRPSSSRASVRTRARWEPGCAQVLRMDISHWSHESQGTGYKQINLIPTPAGTLGRAEVILAHLSSTRPREGSSIACRHMGVTIEQLLKGALGDCVEYQKWRKDCGKGKKSAVPFPLCGSLSLWLSSPNLGPFFPVILIGPIGSEQQDQDAEHVAVKVLIPA